MKLKKAMLFGILAAVFFSATPIMNRSMNLAGGSFLWTASLRYLFTLPILFAIVKSKKQTNPVYQSIKKNPKGWFIWSTVGFGLFYLPFSFASNYGQAWLVVGTWQLTIIAGSLLSPLWGKKIPLKNVGLMCIIIFGVLLLQVSNIGHVTLSDTLLVVLPMLVAAFAYPLGNRKMMDVCRGDDLTTPQRVYGMTICSTPFWIIVAAAAFATSGAPSVGQLGQSLIVAIFSGIIATILFFAGTNMVKDNPKYLAAVEATQSGEVVSTLIGSILLLNDSLPTILGGIGLVVIVLGMILNSLLAKKDEPEFVESENM